MSAIYINNQTGSGKTINSTGNKITVSFNPCIMLNNTKKYQMALINSSIVYCHPNCVGLSLNFVYKGTNYSFPVETGLYGLSDLNSFFQEVTASLYPPNGLINCVGQESTGQILLYCNDYANLQIDFSSPNNIFTILGFPVTSSKFQPSSLTPYLLSTNRSSLNNISTFIITCDIANSFYNNSGLSNLIYSSPISVSPYSTQASEPRNLIWCDIYKSLIDNLTISLVSDTLQNIDMTGGNSGSAPELFSCTVLIREKKE